MKTTSDDISAKSTEFLNKSFRVEPIVLHTFTSNAAPRESTVSVDEKFVQRGMAGVKTKIKVQPFSTSNPFY